MSDEIGVKQRLLHMKNRGFVPRTILDIGAFRGIWSEELKRDVYPTSKYFLVEADSAHINDIKSRNFDFEIALVGDESGKMVDFYRCPTTNWPTGNSIYKENTRHYVGDNVQVVRLPMKTIDEIVDEHQLKNIDFIKLDIQGAELLALKGAEKTLRQAKVVLTECSIQKYNLGAPRLHEVIAYLASVGFIPYDLIDAFHNKFGILCQIDIMFALRIQNYLGTRYCID